jgi:hypothetical protein
MSEAERVISSIREQQQAPLLEELTHLAYRITHSVRSINQLGSGPKVIGHVLITPDAFHQEKETLDSQ